MSENFVIVQQNLKKILAEKAVGLTDKEIAKSLDISLKDFLDVINGDQYLKECYDNAVTKVAQEIEASFIENIKAQLESGDNTDAKWFLERTNPKYSKKDNVQVSVKTIDEIIREKDEQQ